MEDCIGNIPATINFHTLQIKFEFEKLEIFASNHYATNFVGWKDWSQGQFSFLITILSMQLVNWLDAAQGNVSVGKQLVAEASTSRHIQLEWHLQSGD